MPQKEISSIISEPSYKIDDKYFKEIMIDLGMFIAKNYEKDIETTPAMLMSQIAYIGDISVQQKLYISYWLGLHYKNDEYRDWILTFMNTYSDEPMMV